MKRFSPKRLTHGRRVWYFGESWDLIADSRLSNFSNYRTTIIVYLFSDVHYLLFSRQFLQSDIRWRMSTSVGRLTEYDVILSAFHMHQSTSGNREQNSESTCSHSDGWYLTDFINFFWLTTDYGGEGGGISCAIQHDCGSDKKKKRYSHKIGTFKSHVNA